jgi:hypothetical protein
MARMVPSTFADDHGSRAEGRIFAALRDETPKGWVAIHSVGLAGHREKRWAEVDFVVVCEHGVFCLEVKGGALACEAGEWTTNGKPLSESPFAQAGGAEAALRGSLRGAQPDLIRGIVMGWGVVAPDAHFRVRSPEAPPELVYDADDVAQAISAYIERLAAFHSPHTSPKVRRTLTPADVSQLVHAISPSFSLVPSMRAIVDRTDGDVVRLSAQQARVLDGLSGSPRVIVRGGAGTGKTLIASREAIRLADRGLKTLYVCFGKRLAEALRPELESHGVRVIHAHALMHEVIDRAGRLGELPTGPASAELFDELMPTLAMDCVLNSDLAGSVDAVVIDEAQDLLKGPSLDVLDALLRGELRDGTWRVFLDPHQNIFGGDEGATYDRLATRAIEYQLSQNCRNARPIAEVAGRISGIDVPEALVAEGTPPVERWYTDARTFSRELSSQTSAWLAAGVRAEEMMILSPRSFAKTHLPAAKLPRPVVDVSKGAWPVEGRFRFSTIQGFKGLEADVVVLTGFEGYNRDGVEKLLYIGATRTKSLLCLLFDEGMRERLASSQRETL